jgi:hypothetical protein
MSDLDISHKLREAATLARDVADHLCDYYPIVGKAWLVGRLADDPSGVSIHDPMLRLDRLLYPSRLSWNASLWDHTCHLNSDVTPEQLAAALSKRARRDGEARRYRGSHIAAAETLDRQAVWAEWEGCVRLLMNAHDAILKHYGWGAAVAAGLAPRPNWKWPNVPPIEAALLEALKHAAHVTSRTCDTVDREAQVGADSANELIQPSWDGKELRFGGSFTHRFGRVGKNTAAILDTFQETDWVNRIDAPVTAANIRSSVSRLNNALGSNSPIRFEADGRGQGIVWRRC